MPTHIRKPTVIEAAGNLPKRIEEFAGRVNSGHANVSVARMISPYGWQEPGQRPEFEEITVVLRGTLRVEHDGGELVVCARRSDRHQARPVGPLQHAGARGCGVHCGLRAGILAGNGASRFRTAEVRICEIDSISQQIERGTISAANTFRRCVSLHRAGRE